MKETIDNINIPGPTREEFEEAYKKGRKVTDWCYAYGESYWLTPDFPKGVNLIHLSEVMYEHDKSTDTD